MIIVAIPIITPRLVRAVLTLLLKRPLVAWLMADFIYSYLKASIGSSLLAFTAG